MPGIRLAKVIKRVLKALSIILLIGVMIISLSSCDKQAKIPAVTKPEKLTEVNEEANEAQGKIKEAKDYLIGQGLELSEAIDQNSDGNEAIISWADLCEDKQVILLNDFLDDAISDISSHNGYNPVELRMVTWILNDGKTAAEVYFYKDKIIGGVTYSQEETAQANKQYRSLRGETLAQIKNIDYPIWDTSVKSTKIEKPAIYYLECEQAIKDGFKQAVLIQSFEQDRLLITYQNDSGESRVFLYDLNDGTDFYTGISFTEYPHFRVKLLKDNKAAVILSDRILYVDTHSFKVMEESKYPTGEEVWIDDIDISSDGQTIVYSNKNGLAVCDKKFQNSEVIVEAKVGKDPHGQDSEVPRYPLFSPDSSLIMYRMVGYEWLVGTGIIDLDGSNHKYFQADSEETTYTQWYDNDHIYSIGPAYGEETNPVLLNVNTSDKTYLVKASPKNKQIEYFPGKGRLYFLESGLNSDGQRDSCCFGYYDLVKEARNVLLDGPAIPGFYFYNASYDSENNTFSFIVNNRPLWDRPAIMVGI